MSIGSLWGKIRQSWTKVLQNIFAFFGRSLFKSHIPRNPWSNTTLDWCNGVSRCVWFWRKGGGRENCVIFPNDCTFLWCNPGGVLQIIANIGPLFQEPSRDVVSYTAIIICLVIQGSSQEKRRRQRWLTKHWEGLRARETSGMPADDC